MPHNNSMKLNSNLIIAFSDLHKAEPDLIGKKALEILELETLGILIPDGFVITPILFQRFLKETKIDKKIKEVNKLKHPAILDSIDKLFVPIHKEIIHVSMPHDLKTEVYRAYRKLGSVFKEPSLNIFSSSYSNNKLIMFKNVNGDANLILKIKEIWASYIEDPISIVVQKNIESKRKGTIVTNNPSKGLEDLAKKIQKHYYFPKVVDYVIEKNKIYVTSIKPFTGIIHYPFKQKMSQAKIKKILIKGFSINPGVATGPAKILHSNQANIKITASDIVVIPNLNLKMYAKIKKAKAIVVSDILPKALDKMIYRSHVGKPTIEGAKNATKLLHNGHIITVNGNSGEIYQGGII